MVRTLIRQRPRNLLAVYVEPQRVEILRAHRRWRTWQAGPVEQYVVSDAEGLYEYLQRLNLRPKGREHAALVLFVPRCYYSFHRELYPLAIENQLDETLEFDWPENLFNDHEQTLYFHGTPIPSGQQLIVPIFSIQRGIYEKFYQALGGGAFQSFTILPSAPAYKSFIAPVVSGENGVPPLEITGRQIDPLHMEVNRFYKGLLQDSVIIRKDQDTRRLLLENLQCLGKEGCREAMEIRVLCTPAEWNQGHYEGWKNKSIPIQVNTQDDFLLSSWVRDLLEEDRVQGFGSQVQLKPWKVPVVLWVVVGLFIFYSLFASYKIQERDRLAESFNQLSAQRARLESQWKPIEQLQNRIPKLQEGQKALAQFGQNNAPVVGLLNLLSQVTPDDTWMNYLSLKGKDLTLRGESKSAIKYLSDLTRIEGFEDVRFASPVSRNPTSDKERFHIQVSLNMEKLKKTLETLPADSEIQPADTGMQPATLEPVAQELPGVEVESLPEVLESSSQSSPSEEPQEQDGGQQ